MQWLPLHISYPRLHRRSCRLGLFSRSLRHVLICGPDALSAQIACAHVVAMQKHLASRLHAAPGLRVLQFLAVGFDGSMLEIFSALCHGATLVLRLHTTDSQYIFDVLQSVEIAILTPSTVEGLNPKDSPRPKFVSFSRVKTLERLMALTYLLTAVFWRRASGPENARYLGAGAKPVQLLWPNRGKSEQSPQRCLGVEVGVLVIVNTSQVTMGSVLKSCVTGSPVTIGKPLPSARAYVLDLEKQRLTPQGVIGEIVLAGVQVARGCIGMPEETSAKFLPDSISGQPRERMYRTGDPGYWTESGELVCIGRKDRLVKIRGYRVSLGNVEEVLHALPGIHTAATVVGHESLLLAWVTPSGVDVDAVLQQLALNLPTYARPQRIFSTDSLPLTKNGVRGLSPLS